LYPFIAGALFAVACVMVDFAFFTRRFRKQHAQNGVGPSTGAGEKASGLAALPAELRLIICAGGIYACYLTYGVLQEEIYKYRGAQGEKFTATVFLLFVQCLVNALFALALMLMGSRSGDKMPLLNFGITGSAYILAMMFSNEALKYVSYPTQALGKSCKMVPVMLFGVLIRGKRYKAFEYLCVLLVTAGITWFQLAGKKKKGGAAEDSPYGILLLALSLAMDGVTGAVQDKLKTLCKPTVHELMFYTNAAAVVVCALLVVPTGQLQDGLTFCLNNPAMVRHLGLFALTSALGQNFIFLTVKYFDSLVLTTVTTTRKFFTILMSVFIYGHKLNEQQWLAVGLVFLGLSGEVYDKYEKKHAKKRPVEHKQD
jgi:UDP-galactose transporter B1